MALVSNSASQRVDRTIPGNRGAKGDRHRTCRERQLLSTPKVTQRWGLTLLAVRDLIRLALLWLWSGLFCKHAFGHTDERMDTLLDKHLCIVVILRPNLYIGTYTTCPSIRVLGVTIGGVSTG